MKLILASIAGFFVGMIFLAGGAVLAPNTPHVAVGAFFVGVTLTLVLIMRPKTVVRPLETARISDTEEAAEEERREEDADDDERDDDVRDARNAHLARVREALTREPPKTSSLWIIFLGLWFVYDSVTSSKDPMYVVVLAGVLLAHEAGHFVGMKFFGYRDVKVFFIPGFGAATAGKPEGAARWKEGVVLLLGPVPGLVVGGVMLLQRPLEPLMAQIAVMLVIINGINLLPLGVLDGGKLVHLVLFSRRRALEAPFLFCANVGLLGLAFFLKAWFLGAIAALGLLTARANAKLGVVADEVREKHGALSPIAELSDRELGALVDAARSTLPPAPPPSLENLTAVVRNVHERARSEPVTPKQSMFLLAGYVGALAIAVSGGLSLLAR